MSKNAWPVVGHEWAVELLHSRTPQTLLISGPAQIGKTTLALALAARLACLGPNPPCGQCRSCRKIEHSTHPDVRVVRAEADKSGREGVLKIDQVRQLQREAALAPMESPHKIFVLRELERANLPAANALLKTLEEPPPQVTLLLTSARPHALLPTIVSRCQVLALRPLPLAQVEAALRERWGAEAERASLLARLAGGRLGWAVQRLGEGAAWQERTRRLADAAALPRQGRAARLAYAEELSRAADAILPALALWLGWWRDVVLIQQGCPAAISNIDLAAELQAQARQFDSAQVQRFLARLHAASVQVSQNVNIRLLLETVLLHMPAPVI